MTAERALEKMKYDCMIMMEYCECNNGKCDCYINMAIKALEKQIPKRTVWNTESDKRYSVERCPVCRAIVANGEFHDDYCYKCGQRIDYGDNDG